MQTKLKTPSGPKINFKRGVIDMTHGAGGRATSRLVDELFIKAFHNEWLEQRDDNAQFSVLCGNMVMATDAHVISPLFFSGGNIGSLSVHGTINDISMSGARPLHLAASFIIEEGFPLADLKCIVYSMADAAKEARVSIIAGDTKVVERGKGDGVFITTTGIGVVPKGLNISGVNAKPGDCILVSGTLGDHGVAIMSQRQNLEFISPIQSDSASLHDLVAHMVQNVPSLHCLRDPTRGGLVTCLNEIAQQSAVGMQIEEKAIPIHESVKGACELLGLDPLYVANEGKLIAICPASEAQNLLQCMQQHPLGKEAAIIGEVTEDHHNLVQLNTSFGGQRIMAWLSGEQLPRIC